MNLKINLRKSVINFLEVYEIKERENRRKGTIKGINKTHYGE